MTLLSTIFDDFSALFQLLITLIAVHQLDFFPLPATVYFTIQLDVARHAGRRLSNMLL
jgi:hypothetical protein